MLFSYFVPVCKCCVSWMWLHPLYHFLNIFTWFTVTFNNQFIFQVYKDNKSRDISKLVFTTIFHQSQSEFQICRASYLLKLHLQPLNHLVYVMY